MILVQLRRLPVFISVVVPKNCVSEFYYYNLIFSTCVWKSLISSYWKVSVLKNVTKISVAKNCCLVALLFLVSEMFLHGLFLMLIKCFFMVFLSHFQDVKRMSPFPGFFSMYSLTLEFMGCRKIFFNWWSR